MNFKEILLIFPIMTKNSLLLGFFQGYLKKGVIPLAVLITSI